MLSRPLTPSPFPFQLLVRQLVPQQPKSTYQAVAGSRSSPVKSRMLQQTCSCARSKALSCSENNCSAKCAAAELTSLHWHKLWGAVTSHGVRTSCTVEREAAWKPGKGSLGREACPQARLTHRGWRIFIRFPPIISLLEAASAGS